MAERDLVVRIIGDEKDLVRAFDRSSRSAQQFEGRVSKINRAQSNLFKAGVAGLGVGVVFRQLDRMTEAASNLNEEVNKADVVFGRAAREVQTWARTTSDAFGISNRAALAAASGFGQMLQTAGATESEAARMSRRLVELGGDLASFNNIRTDEALLKLRAGLAGEAEPLRVLGVQLSEARVAQEAYRSGIAETGDKLTEQQKVLARYQIILRDTNKAQGDSARTADGLANKQRVLEAKTEDLNAALGELGLRVLPPVISGLIAMANATTGAIDGITALRNKIVNLDIDDPTEGFFVPLSRTLGQIKELPGLKQLRDQFVDVRDAGKSLIDTLQEIDFEATDLLKPGGALAPRKKEIPAFGQPGFKPGGAPAVPLGPSAEQLNRIFDQRLTRSLDRVQDQDLRKQLEALDRIEEMIEQEISRVRDVTRKLNLRDQLLAVQRQEAGIREQLAADFIDALQLGVDRAALTRTLDDDLKALAALEAGVQAQIRASGRTNELERTLLSIEQQRQAIAEQRKQAAIAAAQAQREAANARQFRRLGLTAEGQEPIAGVGVLSKRVANLQDRIKGTALDTDATRSQLRRIARVLSGEFGTVGRKVREAIEGMLDEINDALKSDKGVLPATKSKLLDVSKALKGLTGTPEDLARARNALAGATVPVRVPVAIQGGGATVYNINGPINVNNNDPDGFIRALQKKTARTSTSRRG